MVYVRLASVVAAASLLLMAAADDPPEPSQTVKDPITTPSVTMPAHEMSSIGCFATGIPLENHGHYLYRSPGNCQLVCIEQGKNVMGLSDGENCWCGDKIPALEWKTDNSTCSTTCSGDQTSLCGGPGALWVVLTGVTRNKVDFFQPDSSSSSAKPTSTAPPSTSSASATPTATPSSAPKKESKPNTIAIAVGVVVGILALAAICFGVWFLLRRRRQHQVEEDYRRNAANVNAFVNGGKLHTSDASMNNSRLDPSFVDRRQSNGSIADNEDYSRRILKVTNV